MDSSPPAERTLNLGIYTILAIVLFVFVDLNVSAWVAGYRDIPRLIGLSFGQIGAAVMWVNVGRELTWKRLAICYLVVAVMAGHLLWYLEALREIDEIAMVFTLWAIPPSAALVILALFRWYLFVQRATTGNELQPPRFGVGHLVIATTAIAVVSLVVRTASTELVAAFNYAFTILLIETALFYVVASSLVRKSIALFWKLAVLAVFALPATWLLALSDSWNDASQVNVVQVTVMAVFLIALHLDRRPIPNFGESGEDVLDSQQVGSSGNRDF